MSTRPFFNVSTQELELLFQTAASKQDRRMLEGLAAELAHREMPRAVLLRSRINNLLKSPRRTLDPSDLEGDDPASSPERDAPAEIPRAQSLHSPTEQTRQKMTEPHILERLKGLLEYVRQTASLRGRPSRQVEQHNNFKAHEYELQGLPGVQFDVGTDDDDVWLRVDRLQESAPPAPSTRLLSALIAQSNQPTREPGLVSHATRDELSLLGAELPPLVEGTDPESPVPIDALSLTVQLQEELNVYVLQLWQPWAVKEREVRKTIAKYAELFSSYQMLRGNVVDSPLEMVMGVGISVWDLPDGKLTYPLITKLVELSIDERTHAIEVRPRSPDPRLELDVYTALDNPGVAEVARAGKEHFARTEWHISPFTPSSFEPVLKVAASLLDSKGTYWPSQTMPHDRQVPKAGEHLRVTDTWVLFARPRTSSLFIQDLERFENLIDSGVNLEGLSRATWALLNDPSQHLHEPPPMNYRGLSHIDRKAGTAAKAKDLFFPMPYNDEQVQIVHMLDHQDGVVVQGPPGTGKTHTIANVISHYLALGKRVLVTSMKDPALAVLQEKLPEDIRPLAISLLSSEADGMKQFEHAIRHIAGEITRLSKSDMREQVRQFEQRIDTLHGQVASTEARIAHWARINLEPVIVDGVALQPLDIAKEVATNTEDVELIRDVLTVAEIHSPQFDNTDISSLRSARMALGEDLALLNDRLPSVDGFPEAGELRQAHLDLGRLAEINEQIAAARLPALRDMQQATIEEAIQSHARIGALRRLRTSLDESGLVWLPALEQRIRLAGPQDAVSKLLAELRSEIGELLAYRSRFLSRPVTLPDGMGDDPDMTDALDNLSQGRKPFGLAGFFGKTQEKKQLDQVRVLASPPASAEDWAHVLEYRRFQQKCNEVVVRWNALSPEMSLPILESASALVERGPGHLAVLNNLQIVLREEKAILAMLSVLLPTWKEGTNTPYSAQQLDQALEILDHNLTRNRLEATWEIKSSFQRAMVDAKGTLPESIEAFLNRALGDAKISDSSLMAEWSELMLELRRQHSMRPQLQIVRDVTNLIEKSGAPKWAQSLRSEAASAALDKLLPDNWKDCWRHRRLLTLVESMDGREELTRLSRQRNELESDLSSLYQQAVTTRTWLQMTEKATPAVRSALEAYRVAVSRIGKGTGVRAPRFRRDARDAAEQASPAIPCWIMPHYRVSESLPVSLGEFDLVIIDEASQSDLTALPALLRAKKVLIVGDDQQVSPEGVGLEEEKIRSLMGQLLGNQVGLYRPQMSPDKSVYDLFKVVFAQGQIMLREHFRCVGPIIEYSKREFYNHQLRPLRMPRTSERLDPPLIDVHVLDGQRGNGKTNEGEARFILEEIQRIVSDPQMRHRSIGVVSLIGSEQAQLVWDKISRTLGEEVIQRHQIAFGDARTFQGKERDIMFLSMIVSGSAQASSQEMFRQRYNVAASRARDRMYLVRSIRAEELSPADKLRAGLLQHFQSPYSQDEAAVADLRMLCESPFEREMFDELVSRGYRVQPQVKVGSYRIDMVVEGDKDARLAIECDGDRYHGPDQWEQDMRRQRVLERAGWNFWRCFASNFVLHRDALLADLVNALKGRGIEPLGAQGASVSNHCLHRTYEAFPSTVPHSEHEKDAAAESS